MPIKIYTFGKFAKSIFIFKQFKINYLQIKNKQK
jgi:hypothetical protein